MVYQEQVQRVVQEVAGFSLGAGYLLIKAVAKKIPKLLKEQQKKFMEGALKKGHSKATAEKIFALIEPFAGYGFNKSHSACYARIAYETAYLKARYPVEFMAAMLSADADDTDRIAVEIEECRAMGIEVLPPDINESLAHFTAIPSDSSGKTSASSLHGKIRLGLTAIKGVGESSVRQIIALRDQLGKFASIEDFARRIPSKLLNKKLIEAFAKSGALDSLGDRSVFVAGYDKIADFSKASGDVGATQTDLFAQMGEPSEAGNIEFTTTKEAPLAQRLQWEKETLGLYVSSHPLAGLTKYIAKKARLLRDFTREDITKKVTVAGIVEGVRKITTKKGDTMAIVFLEDPTGKIEVTLFPKTYAHAVSFLEDADTVLVVGGTLDERAGQLQIRADAVKKASLPRMIERAKAEGFFDEEESRHGLSIRRTTLDVPDVVELVDEEGDVIAGEKVVLTASGEGNATELVGALAGFVSRGMPIEEPLKELAGVVGESARESSAMDIRIHTIPLPEQASKTLLLALKGILERFPGTERIQLKIGERLVPLPMTVTMSTILEKKIGELLTAHGIAPEEETKSY